MDASHDRAAGDKGPKRPACDNCKERKTKCDRRSPCSSCQVAGLSCRLTKNSSTERRQRILISARYDEAIENIDRQLGQVLGIVQSLGPNRNQQPTGSYDASYGLSTHSPDADDATTDPSAPLTRGFHGEPSFAAHLGNILDTLGAIVSNPGVQERLGESGSQRISHQLREEVLPPTPPTISAESPPPLEVQHPELQSCQLPQPQLVLKILRLAQTKRQRFFVDVSVVDEQLFSELCQQIFFAINPYSLSTWIIVNVGLYYLLIDLPRREYVNVDLDAQEVAVNAQLLRSNIDASIKCMRIYVDHSERDIQALGLLVNYSMKTGNISRTWKLNSAAARSCLDLGFHRLPRGAHDIESVRKRRTFWFIYNMDKNLAFTLGRPACIPPHEVMTERLSRPRDLPGIPGKMYSKVDDYVALVSDVHLQLFSAAAEELPKHVRTKVAKTLATRQMEIQADLEKAMQSNSDDDRFPEAASLLEILLNSLETIIWQVVPPEDTSQSPVHYHQKCIDAARRTMSSLEKYGTLINSVSPQGWTFFLNCILSYTPFTPFLILISNATMSQSTSDISLLSSVLAVLEPVAQSSPLAATIYNTSLRVYQVAQSIMYGQSPSQPVSISSISDEPLIQEVPPGSGSLSQELGFLTSPIQDFGAVGDWNSLVNAFGGEDISADTLMFQGGLGAS